MTAPELDLEAADLARYSPQEFARIVKDLSKKELVALATGPARGRIVDEIFGRMRTSFKPETAGRLRALIRWRIADSGAPDAVYEMDIADGSCAVTEGLGEAWDPRLALTLTAADFARLCSGNASGVTLFMTGRLKVSGDLGLASSLTRYFDIPKA
jgi:SCP-2 sterol transfer family protein